jgi:hypothetical protein
MGVEIFRFLSSRFDSTMVGTNTMVTYFTNGFFAFEGNVVTGFGSEIFQNEHPKLFGGGGGIRVGSRRARWEPWGHVLVGGAHLQPQTANASKTGLMVQTGGGVDYRVHARLSIRLEGDWVYTRFFSQSQNRARTAFKALPASFCTSKRSPVPSIWLGPVSGRSVERPRERLPDRPM